MNTVAEIGAALCVYATQIGCNGHVYSNASLTAHAALVIDANAFGNRARTASWP